MSIEHSNFFNIKGDIAIIGTSADQNSSLELSVDSTRIEEITQDFNKSAIRLDTSNGAAGELTVKNTVSINRDKFVQTNEGSSLTGNTQHIKLCNNIVTGRVFYQPVAFDDLAQPASILKASIKNNIFHGTSAATGFATRVTESFIFFPFLVFEIAAHDNCFFSADLGTAFYNSANLLGAGTVATIKAHDNTISGFTFGIEDINANVSYLVSKNWWGPSSDFCSTNANCTQYQTCISGICRGPKVVQKQLGYTGIIDASKPLTSSIECPQGCCPPHVSGQNLPRPNENGSMEPRALTLEDMQKVVEAIQSELNQAR